MSALTEQNQFIRNRNRVYAAEAGAADFQYSDGDEAEAKLYTILSQAKDLSSKSYELQSKIDDWPTEYHLSSTRANLLRSLDLSNVNRVLELGCGCGSITRYLGEHSHIQVDAVEGSASRAALAALRCRDLDNVTISVANFNDIQFPKNGYDLVLFVGVTEYAGRFSQRATDQAALQDLLGLARKAAVDDGVTLIAIENRLGLKYMLGANEDHYGVRFVGLDNYRESTGIRTYSRSEWLEQITQAQFSAHQFLYPFPDYKVPTLVVKEGAPSSRVLEGLLPIRSRDYAEHFDLGVSEHRAWQGLLDAGNFEDHANSFLILLGSNESVLQALCPNELSQFEMPELGYDLPSAKAEQRVQDKKIQQHLNAEIIQLQSHTSNLEAKVALMSNSIGWRAMNLVRRIFGKTTI
ncbi:SAM-dependent methyltransferase [Arenicella xantha]|uniref:Methyltransferase family protein n=1 Tax=Arenicella xantha TaxID=644221 RepID=A0A395JFG0_9GAMM|nr:class I SAM-dependent methyltransferase [Arenicella xantha]RBP48448.1 methyltransferase family protein [Arenicella xantha]